MVFQKKLPMSAALRQGGEGVVPPPKGGDPFDLGKIKGPKNVAKPAGPTKIGKGVPAPKFAKGGSVLPKMPSMTKVTKVPRFK